MVIAKEGKKGKERQEGRKERERGREGGKKDTGENQKIETKAISHNLENNCQQLDVLPSGLYFLCIYFYLEDFVEILGPYHTNNYT